MSTPTIEVLLPGALTTVQDLGRPGHMSAGVTPGGVMDRFAASVANILVGNKVGDALLEVTLLGPQFKILSDTVVAITGADLNARIGSTYVRPWTSHVVKTGEVITFGARSEGARAYIAFQGGLDVPLVMGSRSTDLKSRIGGYYGRHLKAGDVVNVLSGESNRSMFVSGRGLLLEDLNRFSQPEITIRVIPSNPSEEIGEEIMNRFFAGSYKIRSDSDRMGFRLDGVKLITQSSSGGERWSEPVATGTIQLPPSGQPIVLMADRQTVGGYPKLGTVITVDIGRLAQKAPGELIAFGKTDLADAQRLHFDQEAYLTVLSLSNR